MILSERITEDAGRLIIQTTHDVEPVLKRAEMLRQSGAADHRGEHRLVGSVPMELVHNWLQEAGVRMDDREAAQDVLRRKLLSGEFSKFRVWNGTY